MRRGSKSDLLLSPEPLVILGLAESEVIPGYLLHPWEAVLANRFRYRPVEYYTVRLSLILALVLHRALCSLSMTPQESEVLQVLALNFYLARLEQSSICVFFYGASSSLEVRGSSTSSITGVFLVLFFASAVIFAFVSYKIGAYSLTKPDAPKSHRRRGFSSRTIAAVFVTTVINLLLFSLHAGIQVATFIMIIRNPPNPDVDHPFSEMVLANVMIQNMVLVTFWAAYLPVSIKLSLSDSVSIRARWRYGSPI